MQAKYRVKGMTCGGCARAVSNAIRAVAADARVEVDVASGVLAVEGGVTDAAVAKAVADAGFEFLGRA